MFTNKNLEKYDSLFDVRGNILIALWGFTYILTTNTHNNPIMFVFFLEKMLYVYNYYKALSTDLKNINSFWENDKLTYTFLILYGVIDLIFGLLFVYLFFVND